MNPGVAQTAAHVEQPQSLEVRPMLNTQRGWRLFGFFSLAVLLTGFVSMLFADLLWRTGWSSSRTLLLALFVILFFFMAIGCIQGVYGFVLRMVGNKSRITATCDWRQQSIVGTSTALVIPVHNENVARVYEGLRTTYNSLNKAGHIDRFDFFILSDTTDPEKWVEEERRWFDLVRDLNALGHIYYRRRVLNEAKKSGNVRDFLSTWGRRYRYFIVFDADSVMRGETVVDLVKLMEANPAAGLIQTVPALVNAESLFGRIQQFTNRLYAPVFITGLNYWAQGFANYWGHNAIIRTEPFMHYCDLPQLPGRKPFGGQILSHDFVEAALMLRENWQVWFAYDLEGSYEETPQGLIENAQRDRRWCEGNLQHGMVLCAKGLRGVSRIHLLLGIFGYLAGPLWLLFLITFHWMRWFHKSTGLSDITVQGFTPYINLSGTQHAFLVFMLCIFVLMLPKMLALIDLGLDQTRRQAFGGMGRAVTSTVAETVFSTLHAPLQMLWHTGFIANILLGTGVSWSSQKRSADGTGWLYAMRRHWGHTAIGVVWGALVWHLDRAMFWWFVPVLAGMVLSIPLSVVISRARWGALARGLGLFLTPEETSPPPELSTLRARLDEHELVSKATRQGASPDIADVVLDPYINAIHVSLQSEKHLNPQHTDLLKKLAAGQDSVRSLSEKLLAAGPDALSQKEKLLVLSDASSMAWLHKHAWLQPGETLAPWWQEAIRRYSR